MANGAPCTLLVFIDDATSTLMQLRFVLSESTFSYFETLELYLAAHGRPVALAIVLGPMADKGSLFGQALGVPRGQPGDDCGPWNDTVWAGPERAEHRDPLRLLVPDVSSPKVPFENSPVLRV